jgi:predicted HicB family RNase H-like nuclease
MTRKSRPGDRHTEKSTGVRIDAKLKKMAKIEAVQDDISFRLWLEDAIRQKLHRKPDVER